MNTQQIKTEKVNGRLHLILSLCIAAALIIGSSAISLFHSPTAQAANFVHAPNASQASGNISMASIPAGTTGEVTVPVMLTGADDVATLGVNIHFDDSKLSIKSCQSKDVGGQCNANFKKGVARFNITHITGIEGEAQLNEFVFEILEPLEADLVFGFEITTAAASDGQPFVLEILEGEVVELEFAGPKERKMFLPLIQK